MKVALGYDEAAYDLKETFRAFMTSTGCEGEELGAFSKEPAPYPEIASAVATAIAPGRFVQQTLFCGAGTGMGLVANKTKGIRAAQRRGAYSAQRAQKGDGAQILSMRARVVGPELAKLNPQTFGTREFEGGRSAAKVARIKAYEDLA